MVGEVSTRSGDEAGGTTVDAGGTIVDTGGTLINCCRILHQYGLNTKNLSSKFYEKHKIYDSISEKINEHIRNVLVYTPIILSL